MNKGVINYSQCWEDPKLLNEALALNHNDTVLSITSGGDNTIFLMLNKPQKIVSLDINPFQNYLLEFKLAASRGLDYDQFLELIGVRVSRERALLFDNIRHLLSEEANKWWTTHSDLISIGVIHAGRFEQFLNKFRRYILPLVHSRRTVATLLNSPSLQAQQNFYENIWNSKRWRLLFRIVTSRFVLKRFARQRELFSHMEGNSVAQEYVKRLHDNFVRVPLNDNYFMSYCLTGAYGKSLPVYLERTSHSFIKNSHMPSIVTADLLEYLKSVPDNTFSKFNLSDVFEALSVQENDSVWSEIIRTAKKDAIVVYWNNLVPRSYPRRFSDMIRDEKQKAHNLHLQDRLFFYDSFHINTILK